MAAVSFGESRDGIANAHTSTESFYHRHGVTGENLGTICRTPGLNNPYEGELDVGK